MGLPQLGWRLALLMAACVYIGNAVKDLICAPRPAGMSNGGTAAKLISPSEENNYALVIAAAGIHSLNYPLSLVSKTARCYMLSST